MDKNPEKNEKKCLKPRLANNSLRILKRHRKHLPDFDIGGR